MPSSPDARRVATGAAASFVEGWRRVIGAPAVAIGVLLATLLAALPFATVVGRRVEAHLGSSLEAGRAAEGWHAAWAAEFGAEAQGLARTLTHEILGFGATMGIASDLVDAEPLDPAIAGAVAAYLVLWVFLWGGILDRFARGRPVRAPAFFSACGTYFFRFLRLAVLVGPLYWAAFRWLHPWLFTDLYDAWTRDLTAEGPAILLRALLSLVFLAVLATIGVVADFAKVRLVVEDRRSAVAAFAGSVRFIRRRLIRVKGLYLINLAALALILVFWRVAAPPAAAAPWLALFVTQAYLLLRIWARLAFAASEVVFFQGQLAHADYTAAPLPVWPESPAAEAIGNLTGRPA